MSILFIALPAFKFKNDPFKYANGSQKLSKIVLRKFERIKIKKKKTHITKGRRIDVIEVSALCYGFPVSIGQKRMCRMVTDHRPNIKTTLRSN